MHRHPTWAMPGFKPNKRLFFLVLQYPLEYHKNVNISNIPEFYQVVCIVVQQAFRFFSMSGGLL